MDQLDEIDAELKDLMRRMRSNEQYDTAYCEAWRNGWLACDQRRILQVNSIREKVWRMRQAKR